MGKKTRRRQGYDFVLPGDDRLEVQIIGYSHGLNILSRMLFEQLPPGADLPDSFLTNMPQEQADIEKMARELSVVSLTSPNKRPVTNAPALYCEYYVEAFIRGYRFSLYAVPHGYTEVMHSIPAERRYELAFRFAHEQIKQEPAPESDPFIDGALERIRAIYKHYRTLN